MRAIKSILVIFVSILVLSACITAKELPQYDVSETTRIGIMNLLEEHVTHTHIGTTAFANYQDTYDVDWKVPELIQSELVNQLKEIGYEAVIIQPTSNISENNDAIIARPWDISLNKKLVKDFEEIGVQNNVDLIFVISTSPEADYIDQSGWSMEGYGFYSRSMLGSNKVFAYSQIRIDAIWTHPPSITGISRHLLRGLQVPDDIKASFCEDLRKIPMSEINKLEPIIKYDIRDLVRRALITSGLVKEPFLSTYFLKCDKPYDLVQDCAIKAGWGDSISGGTRRTVAINAQEIDIAGTADGKVILIMATEEFREGLENKFYPESAELQTQETNKCFEAVTAVLNDNNINILKMIKVISSRGQIDAYLIEVDGDGYSILRQYSM